MYLEKLLTVVLYVCKLYEFVAWGIWACTWCDLYVVNSWASCHCATLLVSGCVSYSCVFSRLSIDRGVVWYCVWSVSENSHPFCWTRLDQCHICSFVSQLHCATEFQYALCMSYKHKWTNQHSAFSRQSCTAPFGEGAARQLKTCMTQHVRLAILSRDKVAQHKCRCAIGLSRWSAMCGWHPEQHPATQNICTDHHSGSVRQLACWTGVLVRMYVCS